MKLVIVEWVDTCNWNDSGWKTLRLLKEDQQPLAILSVGWLIDENVEQVIIAAHIHAEKASDEIRKACGEMIIPTCSIKQMWILEEYK